VAWVHIVLSLKKVHYKHIKPPPGICFWRITDKQNGQQRLC